MESHPGGELVVSLGLWSEDVSHGFPPKILVLIFHWIRPIPGLDQFPIFLGEDTELIGLVHGKADAVQC